MRAVVPLLLVAATSCAKPVELTVVAPAGAAVLVSPTGAIVRPLPLGARLQGTKDDGWWKVEGGVVRGEHVAPFPIAAQPRFVVVHAAPRTAAPARDAKATAWFPIATKVYVADAHGAGGFTALVDGGKVAGFLPAAALAAQLPPVAEVRGRAEAALRALDLAAARAEIEDALRVDAKDARTVRLAAALLADVDWSRSRKLAAQAPEAPWPDAPPSSPVVGPGRAYAAASALRVRAKADAKARVVAKLPIGAAVDVVSVAGAWARVRVVAPAVGVAASAPAVAVVDGSTAGVVASSSPPPAAPAVEGFVARVYLDGAPVDAARLVAAADALPPTQQDLRVLLLERATLAAPEDRSLPPRLLDAALAAARSPAAVLAARAKIAHEQVRGDAPLALTLAYGCRGDRAQAELVDVDELPDDAKELPTAACFVDVPVEPPCPPQYGYYCCAGAEEDEAVDGHCTAEAKEFAEEVERKRAAHAEEVAEHAKKLGVLAHAIDGGPQLRVVVENAGVAPRRIEDAWLYRYVVSATGRCNHVDEVRRVDLDVEKLSLPIVAAGATADVWLPVSRYDGAVYGVVLAADRAAARAAVEGLPLPVAPSTTPMHGDPDRPLPPPAAPVVGVETHGPIPWCAIVECET